MALFKSKKETKAPKEKKVPVENAVLKNSDSTGPKNPAGDFTLVLLNPRITEKATMLAQGGEDGKAAPVYTFDVHSSATKISIAKAVQDVYNVKPSKVRVVQVPAKKVFSRGKAGVKKGGKKAYVYLKAGEKIEIV
ncbi:MAG: 50S ribosomal protein L23 [Patescibacteria group bacterium]